MSLDISRNEAKEMSNFTDYGENLVCSIIAGQSPTLPASLSISLCSSASDAGLVDVSGLPRIALARDLTAWSGTQGAGTTTASNGTSRQISNNSALDFGVAGEPATATAVGIYAGNNPIGFVPMGNQLTINAGDAVILAAGAVILTISTVGGLTHFACNKLLDLIFRGQSYSFQTTYKIGLFTVAPTLAGGGTEAQGGGYARADFGSWTSPSGGEMRNATAVQYNAPLSSWGTIEAAGFFSGSNMIFAAALPSAKTIAAGAGAPSFAAGSIYFAAQ